jgi:predicted nuclease with TOPRIM domain
MSKIKSIKKAKSLNLENKELQNEWIAMTERVEELEHENVQMTGVIGYLEFQLEQMKGRENSD